MQNSSLVTVIIPVYNAEKYVTTAIQSILNQSYTTLEILITDDGSTDNSRNIINEFKDSRIKKYYNDTNIGYLKTCNDLFAISSGDFIAFQDADDWSNPGRIEKIMNAMQANSSIALCGCNFIRINDKNGKVIAKSDYPQTNLKIKEFIETNRTLPFCGASVVFRKTIYNEIGGYRTFFNRIGYEHFDWFLLASEKYQVANIPDSLYYYRYNRNSFSRSDRLLNFKKYYAPEIAWYLKSQRSKTGKDALQNNELELDFQQYINNLEKDFQENREEIYRKVIYQMLSNKDTKMAFSTIIKGLLDQEIKISSSFYYLFRVFKTEIGKVFFS